MSQTIKILGTGCPKCKTLTKLTQEVVTENKLDAVVEKVEDIMQIMAYDVIATPALVVNEKVVVKGRVPQKQEILSLIQSKTEDTTDEKLGGCCCS